MPLFSLGQKTAPRPGSVAAATEEGLIDSTIRPICFGLPSNKVSHQVAGAVGPEKFKKYEHALYVMAQLSRLVYSDTGIMWTSIQKSLGMSSDVVNKVISAYDAQYAGKKKVAVSSQAGDGAGRPMESYSLFPSKATNSKTKFGTYVSTADDMTCVFINGNKIVANPNSIFKASDVIVSFKGSSTMDNFKHDLMSQFTAADLGGLVKSIGVTVAGSNNLVTGSFISPLVRGWTPLMKALTEHVAMATAAGGGAPIRLFLTGHSLGGAYTTLFAFILAEAKVSKTLPIMEKIASIHVISFGAPCIVRDAARNTFNRHLDSGLMTFDRVVSQKVAARSAATQILTGGMAGPNDVVPTIPAGFSHPGYRPLNNPMKNFQPEAKGRPYSMDYIRKFYGVQTKTRYRDPATWPFAEDVKLGDRAKAAELKAIVSKITGVAAVPEEAAITAPSGTPAAGDPKELEQDGGGAEKQIYETTTLKRIPNFVSVEGSAYAYGFAHAEYLGMFFFGGFRLPGMKNPAKDKMAYFEFYNDGVKINYLANTPELSKISVAMSKNVAESGASSPSGVSTPTAPSPVKGGRRNRTKRRSSCSRRRRGGQTRRRL